MGGRNRTPSNHERPLDRLIARPHLVPSSDAKCCRHCRRTLPDSETITPCTHTHTNAREALWNARHPVFVLQSGSAF
jgi:hypothetical protein